MSKLLGPASWDKRCWMAGQLTMSTLKACLKRARECLAGADFPGAIHYCRAALQHDDRSYDALV